MFMRASRRNAVRRARYTHDHVPGQRGGLTPRQPDGVHAGRMMAPSSRDRSIAATLLWMACACLAALPNADVGAILSGLAGCAAVVAAGERRTHAMLLAAGVSLGLGVGGLLLLPALLGVAIARRGGMSIATGGLIAIATRLALGTWSTGATIPTLLSLVLRWPDLLGLLAAISIGFSAWIAARATTLGNDQRAFALISLTSVLGIGLLAPVPAASLFLPLIFLMHRLVVARPLSSYANDNGPIGLRTLRHAGVDPFCGGKFLTCQAHSTTKRRDRLPPAKPVTKGGAGVGV